MGRSANRRGRLREAWSTLALVAAVVAMVGLVASTVTHAGTVAAPFSAAKEHLRRARRTELPLFQGGAGNGSLTWMLDRLQAPHTCGRGCPAAPEHGFGRDT